MYAENQLGCSCKRPWETGRAWSWLAVVGWGEGPLGLGWYAGGSRRHPRRLGCLMAEMPLTVRKSGRISVVGWGDQRDSDD